MIFLAAAILSCQVSGSDDPDRPSPPPTRAARIESVVNDWHEAGLFDGAVLVAERGRVVWSGGVGLAVREWDQKNDADVRYPIASLTKQLTAVLVLRQVERGRIGLDDTIVDHLPWYRPETGRQVKIRDLLAHCSGLPETANALYIDDRPEAEVARWVVETYGSGELEYEPGTAFSYTNTDYHVLGAVLEEVTGKSYEQLVSDEILEPLGMASTGIARRDAVLPRRAQDYVPTGDGGWQRGPYAEWENWQAAGGLFSTVNDLHRWNRALVDHELLSEETTELMLRPRTDVGDVGNYVALGSWVYPRRLLGSELAPTLVERRGAIGGYAALNVVVPDDGHWIVLLANHYNESLHTLPWARCLPLDLLLVLYELDPEGPPPPATDEER